MKISTVIKELVSIMSAYGNIECQLQNEPDDKHPIIGCRNFFIMQESYNNAEGTIENVCTIRSWPY